MSDTHIMIDFETWGASARAVPVQFGAVVFDPDGPLAPSMPDAQHTFYAAIEPASAMKLGFEVDQETLLWWMNQPDVTRLAMVRELTGVPSSVLKVHTFLDRFTTWFNAKGGEYVWSHGATFDAVILMELYKRLGRDVPFHYRNVRDTRTVFALSPPRDEGVWKSLMTSTQHHHPVHDAWAQARAIQYCLEETYGEDHTDDQSGPGVLEREPCCETGDTGAHSEVPHES